MSNLDSLYIMNKYLKKKKFLLNMNKWFLSSITLIYSILLIFGNIAPNLKTGENDKMFHLLAFFIFSIVFTINLWSFNIKNPFIILTPMIFFGMALEYVQYYIPTRYTSYADVFMNVFGIISAYLILSCRQKKVLKTLIH